MHLTRMTPPVKTSLPLGGEETMTLTNVVEIVVVAAIVILAVRFFMKRG